MTIDDVRYDGEEEGEGEGEEGEARTRETSAGGNKEI